jgi:hypothetical protein
MHIGSSVFDHVRPQDFDAFTTAAKRFQVQILVRRTNPQSLSYIGRPGYMPKPVDCKPKTADHDVLLPDGRISRCAGLVVDPMIPGFDKAFRPERLGKAKSTWRKFALAHGIWNAGLYHGTAHPGAQQLYRGSQYRGGASDLPPEAGYTTPHRGGVYLVQTLPERAHFGCLMFCPLDVDNPSGDPAKDIRLLLDRATNRCLHGDYDLFGIVPAEMPRFRVVEQAILYGIQNTYTPQSKEIALFLNSAMKAEMIQHGAQENSDMEVDADEHLDVFWLDGSHGEVRGATAIKELYTTAFAGRDMGASGSGVVA